MKKILVCLWLLVGTLEGVEETNMMMDFFDLSENIDSRNVTDEQLFEYFYPKGISMNDLFNDLVKKSEEKDYILATEYYDSKLFVSLPETVENVIYTHTITFIFTEIGLCEINYSRSFIVFDPEVDIVGFEGLTRKHEEIPSLFLDRRMRTGPSN